MPRNIFVIRCLFLTIFAISIVGSVPAPAEEAETTPLSAEQLWQIARLGSPTISPDGEWAALSVTTFDVAEDEAHTDLWLVSTAGEEARRLTTHDAKDDNPVWSPDGKWIAFESKRGDDEQTQIYVISTGGGEARQVTKVPTGASAAKWFPGSDRIAFITRIWPDLETWEEQGERVKERKESKVTAKTWDRPLIRWWDHWIDDREAHVYHVALEGGDPVAVTWGTGRHLPQQQPSPNRFDIAPDGGEIAFVANVDETGVDPNFDVFVVPADGGTAVNLSAENPAGDFGPLYSPDGTYLAFGRQVIKGFYADRIRLVLHDREAGANRIATDDWDRSVTGLVWAPDGDALYGAIDDAGHRRVYRIAVPSGEPTPLTTDHSFSGLALSPDGQTLVALRQGFVEPPTLVSVALADTGVTKLSAFNDEVLAKVDLGTYESVTYTGAGGDEVQMWINYPPGFDRSRKWPLYLLLHGGPHNGVTDSFHWRWNAQVFSGWGYVTAWHNFHGSSGFGQAFTDSINPMQSELTYEDTILAAGYLAAQPWIDADRMASGGGSFGGYLAAILLGREHPFKTIVAHAAVYNWYTQYGADYAASQRRHGEFWENPEVWETSSPHFGAGNFTTPTLVIHGENDYRVPLNHGIELFNTLQNRGVRSRLIYYPDENHWVLKPNNSLHWYAAKQKWLEEFIGTGPTE
jgi:dipeptidyl aminopeptidase/acylaminoacyl peptidase